MENKYKEEEEKIEIHLSNENRIIITRKKAEEASHHQVEKQIRRNLVFYPFYFNYIQVFPTFKPC